MKSKGPLMTQEWACGRHGVQAVAAKASKPKCRWCGNLLERHTWVMRA